MITNLEIYLAIAEEAHSDMRAAMAKGITPKPNGEPGFVMRSEPDRRSFKQAMIAIAFAGMYLEALIYIVLQNRFGRTNALKLDRLPYEDRLKELGITDDDLHNRVKVFRDARKDLVHEKAVAVADIGNQVRHVAQDAADNAMSLVHDLTGLLRPLFTAPAN